MTRRRFLSGIAAGAVAFTRVSSAFAQRQRPSVRVMRLLDRPIITPELDPSLGPNIQGPSLISVPDWVSGRLGSISSATRAIFEEDGRVYLSYAVAGESGIAIAEVTSGV